jgi:hypothetical protein
MITEHIRTPRRAVAAATLAVGAFALAACSSSANGGTNAATTPPAQTSAPQTSAAQTGAPQTSAAETSAAAEPNTLSVETIDSAKSMSFDISGTPHAGLVTITVKNTGKYAHEMGLALVKPGVTLEQVKTNLLSGAPDAEEKAKALQVDPDHEITAPAIVGPGLTEQATVPLVAGHYIVTCFLPGPDGMPHIAMGMISEFTVAEGADTGQPPASDGTITLTDKAITLPDGFTGTGTFTVTNTGTAPHDFSVASLKAAGGLGALFQCVGASMGKGTPIDTCPGTLVGGVTTLAPGASAYVTLQLPSGHYGYVSTQGEGKDFQAGLNGEFDVA